VLKLEEVIKENPIIAAVRDMSSLPAALKSRVSAIFLLCGEICSLGEAVAAGHRAGKPIFLHIDLVEGLGRDKAAIKYLAQEVKPDGIITTRSHLIRYAKDYKLYTIQRIFVLDSLSLKTGIANVKETEPDALECLPGIMPRVLNRLARELSQPVIAGGLIRSREEIEAILAAGAVAVSLSEQTLWQ